MFGTLLEVTGVSDTDPLDCLFLVLGRLSTEALRKALAESKLAGMNLGVFPLMSGTSTQLPLINDSEQSLTALASSWQSEKVSASLVCADSKSP